MKNRDFEKQCAMDEELSAYVDGDMDRERARALAEHLTGCKACGEAVEEIKGISLGLNALSGEEPPAYLWSKIEREHKERAERPVAVRIADWWRAWWKVPALASAAAAAAVLAIVLNSGSQLPAANSKKEEIAAGQSFELEQIRALSSVESAEQVYSDAIASLEKSLSNEKKTYSAKVRQTIDKTLADVDGAIALCKDAIKRDPKNLDARRRVLAAYQQKVDLLTELVVERR